MYRSHNLKGCSGGRQRSSTFSRRRADVVYGSEWWEARAPAGPPEPAWPCSLSLGPRAGVLLAPVPTEHGGGLWGPGRQGQNSQQAAARARHRLPCWARGRPGGRCPRRGPHAGTGPAGGSPRRPGSPGSAPRPRWHVGRPPAGAWRPSPPLRRRRCPGVPRCSVTAGGQGAHALAGAPGLGPPTLGRPPPPVMGPGAGPWRGGGDACGCPLPEGRDPRGRSREYGPRSAHARGRLSGPGGWSHRMLGLLAP